MTSPVPASSRPGGTAALPRCAVCGTESRQAPFRASPPEQAPDLDLRPGEPVRSAMARWLQQCPSCGYAAPDITKAHPAAALAVAAAPFRALLADASLPPLARRFLAWAHVLEETGALPDMLMKIADVYEDEVDNAVGALTSLLEPIMIVFLAVIVGSIVIALFLPLIKLMDNLGQDGGESSEKGSELKKD